MASTWNHRIMRHKGADAGDDYYSIHEVHYRDGRPVGYTEHGVDVGGNSVEELRVTLERMLRCLALPVLTPADFNAGVPASPNAPDKVGSVCPVSGGACRRYCSVGECKDRPSGVALPRNDQSKGGA